MADFLKEFEEGEDILASDTNANNQYLLSKLTSNAEAVQTYLEQQLSSIKSNISSIQATLQNNIDNLTTDINSKLAVCYLPNYSKMKTISSGFVASSNGWIKWTPTSGDGGTTVVYVNGVEVFRHYHYKYKNNFDFWLLIGASDTVTFTGSSTVQFCPCRTGGNV